MGALRCTRKSTALIIRRRLERDEGIVYAASDCRCHIDGEVWHLNIRGEMMETSFTVPAYNGELQSARGRVEDNTVGSLTEVQRSLVVGCLLGDGAMRCKQNALLEINHSFAQKEYVDWKYRLLSNLVGTPPRARDGNGGRRAYRFTTLSLPQLTPYYAAFYVGGRKIVPKIEITPLCLAVWFMDDGSRSRSAVYLNAQHPSFQYKLPR